MRRFLLIATVFLLSVVVATAGCIITDTESISPEQPTTTSTPFAGDPIVGVWTGELKETFAASGTGEMSETTTSFEITVEETGEATVSYVKKEIQGFSSKTSSMEMPGTVTKADNVYTIEAQLLGTYVITLSADGTATLTTPNAKECELTK